MNRKVDNMIPFDIQAVDLMVQGKSQHAYIAHFQRVVTGSSFIIYRRRRIGKKLKVLDYGGFYNVVVIIEMKRAVECICICNKTDNSYQEKMECFIVPQVKKKHQDFILL